MFTNQTIGGARQSLFNSEDQIDSNEFQPNTSIDSSNTKSLPFNGQDTLGKLNEMNRE